MQINNLRVEDFADQTDSPHYRPVQQFDDDDWLDDESYMETVATQVIDDAQLNAEADADLYHFVDDDTGDGHLIVL